MTLKPPSLSACDTTGSEWTKPSTRPDLIMATAPAPPPSVTADTSPSHIHLFAKLHVQVLHKPISFQERALAIEKTIMNRQENGAR